MGIELYVDEHKGKYEIYIDGDGRGPNCKVLPHIHAVADFYHKKYNGESIILNCNQEDYKAFHARLDQYDDNVPLP